MRSTHRGHHTATHRCVPVVAKETRTRKWGLGGRALLVAAAMLAILARGGVAHAQATTDSQVWIFGEGQAELTKKLRLDVEQQLRLDDSARGFGETFTDIGLRYRLFKPLRIGAFYRFVVLDAEMRHRVGGDAEAQVGVGRVGISYRIRLQYTTRDAGGRTALRNRLKLDVGLPHGFTPFAAGELIYVFEKSELRERRLYLGVEWAMSTRIGLTAFYLHKEEVNVNDPETDHVLGLGLSFLVLDHKGPGKARRAASTSPGDE